MVEGTFITDPIIFDKVKIRVVEGLKLLYRVFVVEYALSMELILVPVAFISRLADSVVKGSITVHFILREVAFVVGSIRIREFAFAFFHPA
jgi:hypothetical protein